MCYQTFISYCQIINILIDLVYLINVRHEGVSLCQLGSFFGSVGSSVTGPASGYETLKLVV